MIDLMTVLHKHKLWLESESGGERAIIIDEDLSGRSDLNDLVFDEVVFINVNFAFSKLCLSSFVHAVFSNCNLQYTDLYKANLYGVKLYNTNLDNIVRLNERLDNE